MGQFKSPLDSQTALNVKSERIFVSNKIIIIIIIIKY